MWPTYSKDDENLSAACSLRARAAASTGESCHIIMVATCSTVVRTLVKHDCNMLCKRWGALSKSCPAAHALPPCSRSLEISEVCDMLQTNVSHKFKIVKVYNSSSFQHHTFFHSISNGKLHRVWMSSCADPDTKHHPAGERNWVGKNRKKGWVSLEPVDASNIRCCQSTAQVSSITPFFIPYQTGSFTGFGCQAVLILTPNITRTVHT